MNQYLRTFPTAAALGRTLAGQIADGLAAAESAGSRYVLGCPGGRSARTTYQALAAEVRQRRLAVDHLVIAMMDEYVQPTADGFRCVPAEAHFSCRGFADREIAGPLAAAAGVDRVEVWLPDPGCPARYDGRLRAAGGIDLFILASGASDGHVAFNPPGTDAGARTRVVELAASTRQDNVATFPDFTGPDDVPTHGVTVGPATIVEQSHRAVLVLLGPDKQQAYQRISTATRYDPDWPATVIADCPKAEIFADQAASAAVACQP